MKKVRVGDPSNVEAHTARTYWTLLLGKDFRRNRSAEGINALLNYGYTVLRACVARHVMAAGLHPGVALHHANEANAMRLVDDLMEPFRPLVDGWVLKLFNQGHHDVSPISKSHLGLLPTRNLLTHEGTSPLTLVVQRLCTSLAQHYQNPEDHPLALPIPRVEALRPFWEDDHAEIDTEEGSTTANDSALVRLSTNVADGDV